MEREQYTVQDLDFAESVAIRIIRVAGGDLHIFDGRPIG